ncbi:MAG: hypothetical protein Q9201_002559 [Fulgogasparrea decipioides]
MPDPFSVAAGTAGVVSLGIKTCSALLQYYDSWKDSRKDVAALYRSLDGLNKTLILIRAKITGQTFAPDVVQRITECIISCNDGILALKTRLTRFGSETSGDWAAQLKTSARRLQYPLKKHALLELRETISDLRDNLSLAVVALQIDVSAHALRRLDDITHNASTHHSQVIIGIEEIRLGQQKSNVELERQTHKFQELASDQERNAVLRWLSSLTPSTFIDRYNDSISRRTKGTGDWILGSEQFETWINGKQDILWCFGIPGAGKSVAILLTQVIRQQSKTDAEVKQLYKTYHNNKTYPAIEEYVRILKGQTRHFSKIFILVDALDECSEDGHTRSRFIQHLQALLPHISLLVTSRKTPDIEATFAGVPRLEIRALDKDVRLAIIARIGQEPSLKRFVEEDPPVGTIIIDTIIEKTSGMFLLADLHINSLAREDNRRGLFKALKTLPAEIKETYQQILLRIESQDSQKLKRANEVLLWLTHAQRPLRVPELRHALSVELDDQEFIEDGLPDLSSLLSACCGLVVVDSTNDIIRLTHYTAAEFFETIKQQRYPSGHTAMAAVCLTYLSFKNFTMSLSANAAEAKRLHGRHYAAKSMSKESHEYKLFENHTRRYALLRYAACYWGDHARLGFEDGCPLSDQIMQFLGIDSNVSYSMQVYESCSFHWSPHMYIRTYPQEMSGLHICALFGLARTALAIYPDGAGGTVHALDVRGWTPLHLAVSRGHVTMAKQLLEWGVHVDAKTRLGDKSIHLAARAGHTEVVELLLNFGAHPNSRGYLGPASWYALSHNHEAVLRLLVMCQQKELNVEMLAYAISQGKETAVHMILQESNETSMIDKDQRSQMLLWITRLTSVTIVELLLGQGADVHRTDKTAATCLHLKIRSESREVLLNHGADVDARDSNGRTPLHRTVERQDQDGTLQLVERGANLNIQDRYGRTPLMIACERNSPKIAALLIQGNAHQCLKNEEGYLAVDTTILYGDPITTDMLLQDKTSPEDHVFYVQLAKIYQLMHSAYNLWDPKSAVSNCTVLASDELKQHARQLLSELNSEKLNARRDLVQLKLAAARGFEPIVQFFIERVVDLEAEVVDHVRVAAGEGHERWSHERWSNFSSTRAVQTGSLKETSRSAILPSMEGLH